MRGPSGFHSDSERNPDGLRKPRARARSISTPRYVTPRQISSFVIFHQNQTLRTARAAIGIGAL